ncbi:MAG: hypothetical protein GY820_00805, partial [Gammaproteobacteria bacterium]|nr:hypothetical protein [Gammaproteobacteria bacterium]
MKAQGAKTSAMRNLTPDLEESPIDSHASTSLNICTVASNVLSEAYVPCVPGSGPMPLQCVEVPKISVNVEGKTTAGKQELLGREISPEPQVRMSVPKIPAVWAKTQHTQISLLKPCVVARSLGLDTLPRGKFQLDSGLRRLVPDGIITRPSARQKVEFTENIPPKPPDNSMDIEGALTQNIDISKNSRQGLDKPLAHFDQILAKKS